MAALNPFAADCFSILGPDPEPLGNGVLLASNGNQQSKNGKKPAPVFTEKSFQVGELEKPVSEEQSKENEEIDLLIKKTRVDPTEKLTPPPDAIRIMQDGALKPVFSDSNFSIIAGFQKSKKTFMVCMFLVAALVGHFQNYLFGVDRDGVVILFDTEQSRYKVLQIIKRMCRMCSVEFIPNIDVYSLRGLSPDERTALIARVLATTPNIKFVAIDGIVDLEIDPILQADQAQRIIQNLMQWSELYKVHIMCVLHYNKNVQTLLGHIGSFGQRKGESVIQVAKSKDNPNISTVEAIDCREKEFSPFAFSINDDGLPYILEDYVSNVKSGPGGKFPEKKPAVTAADISDEQHKAILTHVFRMQKEHGYTELWRNIKLAVEEITGSKIGDNKSKDFASYYQSKSDIIKVDMVKGKVVYTMTGQKALEFSK